MVRCGMSRHHKTTKEGSLIVNMIAGKAEIGKFFFRYGFQKLLSSVPQRRLGDMLIGLALKGNQSRTTDFAELGQCCRTTYGYFLSTGKWDEAKVSEKQRQEEFQTVSQLAAECGTPIYLSIDDTVVEKKKPSSKAKHPMEGTGWHYSHLERKQVFGYQIFGAHINTGNTALCYELRRCCPKNGSKIDTSVQLLDNLPETNVPIIALMDSWYTCQRLWDKVMEKGLTMIGALKSNRILYPNGKRCPASKYAASLPNGQYHLVKVGGHEYWVHRYEGTLNGIGHAAVLLSYPKNSFKNELALRLFLCSDTDFSDEKILSHYPRRWKIEVMFKQHKMYLGLKSFMVRSAKAIDRLLVLLTLAHFFFLSLSAFRVPLSTGIHLFRELLCIF